MADSRDIEKLKRRWEENPKGTSFAPLAELYRKDGQHERALEVLRIGLESNPNHIPGNIVLGRCCLDLKQDPEAEAAFSKALELDPENVIALKALAEICERSGRLELSEQWLTQLVQVDPSNDDARDQLGRVRRAREVVAQASAETLEMPPVVPVDTPAAEPASPLAAELLGVDDAVFEAAPVTASFDPTSPTIEPVTAPAPMFFEEPAAVEPAPPLPDLVPAEFDTSAAASVTPDSVAGMMIEDPEAGATPPIPDYQAIGGDFSGSGIERLDVGVEKSEEIVLRVNATSEFQTASASDDLAASFAFNPPAAPPPVEPPPPPIVEERVIDFEAMSPPEPPPALTVESAPPTAAPEVFAVETPPADLVPAALVVDPKPEPAAPPPIAAAPLPIIYPPAEGQSADVDEIVAGGEPEPILTETMAELYLRQGHRHEALRVYRQLAARTPGDVHLRERVAELAASVAEGSAARRAAVAFSATATGGQSVEALFRELLGTSLAGAEGGTATGASGGGEAESNSGAPTRPAQNSLSLSAIFGEDASPIRPPVTPAMNSPEPAGGGETGKQGVSFDQFFGDKAAGSGGGGGRPRRNSKGGADEDLDQFQSWLKGLKR
jgi:hypothetical protein